nr:Chain B, 30S ribosomal protein S2 [Escherichia coli K-12]7OXK_C Chain C, 30S ribosomal protein S2 [Escherichia coli K-12]
TRYKNAKMLPFAFGA